MELTLLGTGTTSPVQDRTPACYFLSMAGQRFLLDPGPGALNRMVKAGISPFNLDSIILTHHHLDHSADLFFYLFSYKNCFKGEKRDVKIVAPVGFSKVFDTLMQVYGDWILSCDYQIKIDEVSEAEWAVPGMTIKSLPMLHGANAVGYRFEADGGPVFSYSGDTGYCDNLIALAGSADVLLVECSFPDDMEMEGHMTPSGVARAGIRSQVKKIVLTHFYPEIDTSKIADTMRSAGYNGNIVVGEDGMVIKL
ncbi:hypothetical protein MNBD_NITROSPINAE01-208 [hydrothermal vent metagenome]|uniref:Metallo-beta-lactamase domain-containing protein n=1 Tax=hydrothermal vent metagenome TaxID=652676 RepID=A0A3B1BPL3_9ZZZZ